MADFKIMSSVLTGSNHSGQATVKVAAAVAAECAASETLEIFFKAIKANLEITHRTIIGQRRIPAVITEKIFKLMSRESGAIHSSFLRYLCIFCALIVFLTLTLQKI
jgi:hypothetical protein